MDYLEEVLLKEAKIWLISTVFHMTPEEALRVAEATAATSMLEAAKKAEAFSLDEFQVLKQ